MRKLDKKLLEIYIDHVAHIDIMENNVFGSAYAVHQNGELVCKKYFGVTGLETYEKVNHNTIFRIASMTKPITSIAILLLIDKGAISLEDPIIKFFPQFENMHIKSDIGDDLGVAKTDVNIMHLLTHTSGFGNIDSKDMTFEDKKTIYGTMNYFVNKGLAFEPFTKQAYSSIAAFDVLAGIVEKVTNEDFEDFLKHEIFLPCNMIDTTFNPSPSQWSRIITMHDKRAGENCAYETIENCVFEDFPCTHKLAGAGLISTLDDYANFAEMLLNKGVVGDVRLLSEDVFNLLSEPYVPVEIMPSHYQWGLGVRVVTDKNYQVLPVGSFGWSGAYGSHFWVDPQNNITAVFMKNSKIDGGMSKSAYRFEEAVNASLID